MAKNIVLCPDGTGNKDIKNRGTNDFKLYEAVDIQGHKSRCRIPFAGEIIRFRRAAAPRFRSLPWLS